MRTKIIIETSPKSGKKEYWKFFKTEKNQPFIIFLGAIIIVILTLVTIIIKA